MAVTEKTASLDQRTVDRIQEEVRGLGLDGWLLFNFQSTNAVASKVLGLPALTRRYFVLIPADGPPIALTHAIEQQPWNGFPGERRVYLSWLELESELARLLGHRPTVAMEYEAGNGVPYVDRLPCGVIEMVRQAGASVVSSADLVSGFHSRWSAQGLESHRRAARIVQETADAGFRRIREAIDAGRRIDEWEMRSWIREELERRGLRVGADSIVAVDANAANPHYAPGPNASSVIGDGQLVLIDLWGKENEHAVYADQTWMGYVGDEVPARIQQIWEAARDAREAAIALLRERSTAGEVISGADVDDAARAVITERGYGEFFIHRTGHSIDTELHGSGPNIDNLETRDGRTLIPGVGFSIEPGIYLPGDVGFRTEVDVYMGAAGAEVTTPDPQRELVRI